MLYLEKRVISKRSLEAYGACPSFILRRISPGGAAPETHKNPIPKMLFVRLALAVSFVYLDRWRLAKVSKLPHREPRASGHKLSLLNAF